MWGACIAAACALSFLWKCREINKFLSVLFANDYCSVLGIYFFVILILKGTRKSDITLK